MKRIFATLAAVIALAVAGQAQAEPVSFVGLSSVGKIQVSNAAWLDDSVLLKIKARPEHRRFTEAERALLEANVCSNIAKQYEEWGLAGVSVTEGSGIIVRRRNLASLCIATANFERQATADDLRRLFILMFKDVENVELKSTRLTKYRDAIFPPSLSLNGIVGVKDGRVHDTFSYLVKYIGEMKQNMGREWRAVPAPVIDEFLDVLLAGRTTETISFLRQAITQEELNAAEEEAAWYAVSIRAKQIQGMEPQLPAEWTALVNNSIFNDRAKAAVARLVAKGYTR